MAESDLFRSPKMLVNVAKANVDKLNASMESFVKKQKRIPVEEKDPKTGNIVHKMRLVGSIPDDITYASYNIVNDLRNALDQAVCSAAKALCNDPEKTVENAYFPFAESPADLKGRLIKDRKFSDIPTDLHPFLEALQPYPASNRRKGGDGLLRTFGKVANPNKHQAALDLLPNHVAGSYYIRHLAGDIVEFRDPTWNAANQEMTICTTKPGGKVQYSLEIPFCIAFTHIPEIRSVPVPAFLREIVRKVEGIVLGLEAETARILRSRSASCPEG